MRYFLWDYEAGEVIGYEREGECNMCGACCKARIVAGVQQVVPDKLDARWFGQTTNGVGQWAEADDGKHRYFISLKSVVLDVGPEETCKYLGDENKCAIRAFRPTICRVWPMIPAHVEPFKECSYTFRETGRWPIPVDDVVLPILSE